MKNTNLKKYIIKYQCDPYTKKKDTFHVKKNLRKNNNKHFRPNIIFKTNSF